VLAGAVPRASAGGSVLELRDLSQWYLKITDYSDRLLDDMDLLEWSDSVLARQRA
jgi:leucyl-tRNA synthetase